MRSKCYISGKITGLPLQEVRDKFARAKEDVMKMGYIPVSPLENGLPDSAEWIDHMEADIRLLMGCEAIYLLPDWRESVGARIEACMAEELRIDKIHQN